MIKTEQVVMNEFAGVRTGQGVRRAGREHHGGGLWLHDAHPRTGHHHHAGTAHVDHPAVGHHDVARYRKGDPKGEHRPVADNPGQVHPLAFPELSTERRQEFVKLIKKQAEDGRVAVRHVRREAMDLLKKHAHDSGVTEDEEKQCEKDLQKLTDDYTAKIDAQVVHKEKEIMTV